jgi:alpha-D-ribose 1-methylphosphonate 5-triphosphate diphosphatase PhnM
MMQDPKDKKSIMADAYSDKRIKALAMATKTPYQMEMASRENAAEKIVKGAKEGAMEMAKLGTAMKLSSGAMKLGSMKKKSFPDLNKDGKVTKADVLKGRGVIK